ncbi:steroid 5-alpha-reductase DET2-like [Malania oleifera]|uniref:steroid 5-alpha-reductase DET2-like n=1 Tax=Malania oleifera TaxID=397392 RepID=UPI0025AE3F4B|nr:steroid 5-alpha-reductase DET2-like [Malania oleifera]
MFSDLLQKFVFPSSDLFAAILSPMVFLFLAYLGFSEIRGRHLQYSKFSDVGNGSRTFTGARPIKVSSSTGMLILYTPAFLAGVASFFLFPDDYDLRFFLLRSAVTLHFFKRVLEVLFVHKYSGGMILDSAILISIAYASGAAFMIYAQHLTRGSPAPPIDLKYIGVALFLVGISGNFYHHYLLSKLRDKGTAKGYKLPRGGFFNLVICPHYFFEILGFVGISCISQTSVSFSVAIGTGLYLMGRSYMTRKWYLSKFENFPKEVRALIPYVF